MLIIDEYTRMTWVAFLKENREDFENFKIFKEMDENDSSMKAKFFDQIMGENLPQMNSMSYVKVMELRDNFQLQKLLNRMGLLKGKQNYPRSCQNYSQ